MIRPSIAVLLTGVSLTGCITADEPVDGPQLLVPDEVEVRWDLSWNELDDDRMALVPVDLMLYDGATGEPAGGVALTVATSADAAILVPEAIAPVDPAEGEFLPDVVWDAWRDRYFAMEPDVTFGAATEVRTDPTGLARVVVAVDTFPNSAEGLFSPIPVVVSMGGTDETFLLVPR